MKRLILLVIVCSIGAYYTWSGRPIQQPPGVLAAAEPEQKPLAGQVPMLERNGYTIKPLAQFAAQARVLLRSNYRFDEGADVAPVDLALGWGMMSDSQILEQFEFSQSNRFYFWSTPELPIPRQEVVSHSANMHMIPATATIEKQLKNLRSGNLIRFSGYLVEVVGKNGWRWRSSLTRTDSGNGACELVWVNHLEVD